MAEKHLPVYQIQDFNAQPHNERYFYLSPLSRHLKEHLFIQKPHKHDFFILLVITQGTGTHIIDFKEHPVAPATVFILSPGQVHSWQLSDDTDGFIIFFSPEFYLLEYPYKKLYSYPFFNTQLHSPMLLLTDAELRLLLNLIHRMQHEHRQQLYLKEDLLRNYLDILLIHLARLYRSQLDAGSLSMTALPQLQLLENLIDKHYQEHLPVSFYAAQLHLSARQLNEVSKRITGKTTTELIQSKLILEAQRLLVHSHLTVSQIAAELGYFDNAYFFRFFKKHVGQTPEQFRSSHS